MSRPLARFKEVLGRPGWPWAAAALGMVLASPALRLGFVSDDWPHRAAFLGPPPGFPWPKATLWNLFRFAEGNPETLRPMLDSGAMPWWAGEYFRLAFIRPLSIATHFLDYRIWPDSPFMMHLHSILWLGGLILLAGILFRRIPGAASPAWVAGLAAFFFAVDEGHGIPAGWLANRNALVSAVPGVAALLLHEKARREGSRAATVLSPLLFLAALFAGETAAGAAAYLFARAVCLEPGLSWKRRAATILPHAAAGFVWAATYRMTGSGASGSEVYIDPGGEPLRLLWAMIERAPLLMLGQWALPPADVYIVFSAALRKAHWIAAALGCAGIAWTLLPLLRRDAAARYFALGMTLALVPACATFASNRLLLFPSLGAAGLLALFIRDWAPSRRGPSPGLAAAARRWGGWKLLAFNGVLAPLTMPFTVVMMKSMGDASDGVVDTMPRGEALAGRDLVIVNPPTPFLGSFALSKLAALGEPIPRSCHGLCGGGDGVTVERPDERTLILTPAGGFLPRPGEDPDGPGPLRPAPVDLGNAMKMLSRLPVDPARRFRPGEKFSTPAFEVEVLEVTPDARPSRCAFRFAEPPEAARWIWLEWSGKGVKPWVPPPPSGRVELAPLPPMF